MSLLARAISIERSSSVVRRIVVGGAHGQHGAHVGGVLRAHRHRVTPGKNRLPPRGADRHWRTTPAARRAAFRHSSRRQVRFPPRRAASRRCECPLRRPRTCTLPLRFPWRVPRPPTGCGDRTARRPVNRRPVRASSRRPPLRNARRLRAICPPPAVQDSVVASAVCSPAAPNAAKPSSQLAGAARRLRGFQREIRSVARPCLVR